MVERIGNINYVTSDTFAVSAILYTDNKWLFCKEYIFSGLYLSYYVKDHHKMNMDIYFFSPTFSDETLSYLFSKV